MTHEIHQRIERTIKRSTLLMGAVLIGGLVEAGRTVKEDRQPDTVGVKSYFEDGGPSFIFVGGCGENNQAQASLFYDKLHGRGSMHFEYQTQGRYSQEKMDQSLIDACTADGDRDRVLVCTSMGLLKSMRSLMNSNVRSAIGNNRLKAIVSRSGITSKNDLQPSMQRAAAVSAHMPHLSVIGNAWRWHRLRYASGDIAHSSGTTDAEARIHHESSAYLPFQLVASQHRLIHKSQPWPERSHDIVTEENPELRLYHITAKHDHVANWRRTNESLFRSFGVPVETILDSRRPHGSHADDLEFIEPLGELMNHLSERHRNVGISARHLVAYSDNSSRLGVAA